MVRTKETTRKTKAELAARQAMQIENDRKKLALKIERVGAIVRVLEAAVNAAKVQTQVEMSNPNVVKSVSFHSMELTHKHERWVQYHTRLLSEQQQKQQSCTPNPAQEPPVPMSTSTMPPAVSVS